MLTDQTIARLERIKALEKKFKARVVTFYGNRNNNEGMILTETADLFEEISERIDRYKRLIIIMDSKGGTLSAAWRIARLIDRRQGVTVVLIPEKAKSAATLIALAADELVMLKDAELGPLDPQIEYEGRSVSALDLMNSPDPVIRSAAERVIRQMREYISLLVEDREIADRLANRFLLLNDEHASHVSSIFLDEAQSLGLRVRGGMDIDVRGLHQLYKRSAFCEHDTSTVIEYFPF